MRSICTVGEKIVVLRVGQHDERHAGGSANPERDVTRPRHGLGGYPKSRNRAEREASHCGTSFGHDHTANVANVLGTRIGEGPDHDSQPDDHQHDLVHR